jgi:hypothetical protein
VALNDPDLRKALLAHPLVKSLGKAVRVVPEMGIQKGRCRADIAVVCENFMAGFELKGENDSLARLPVQVELYSAVFDTCTLVAATKHLAKATGIVPAWWGLVEAKEVAGKVVLAQVRGHGINPYVDAMTIARLIWKDEAEALLRQHGAYKGMAGANREILYYRLLRLLGPVAVKSSVCHILRSRQGWRVAYKGA